MLWLNVSHPVIHELLPHLSLWLKDKLHYMVVWTCCLLFCTFLSCTAQSAEFWLPLAHFGWNCSGTCACQTIALFFLSLCTSLCMWGSWLLRKLSSSGITFLLVLLILTAPPQYLLLAPFLLPSLLSVTQSFILGHPVQHWTSCTNDTSTHMSKADHLLNSRFDFPFSISNWTCPTLNPFSFR